MLSSFHLSIENIVAIINHYTGNISKPDVIEIVGKIWVALISAINICQITKVEKLMKLWKKYIFVYLKL